MKKYPIHIILCGLILAFTACDSFKDAYDAKEVAPLSISVNVDMAIEDVASFSGLKIKFENGAEAISETRPLEGNTVNIDGILPGIYNIYVSGKVKNTEGTEFYLNGAALNQPLYGDKNKVDIVVKGVEISPLVFKEIYYANTPKTGTANAYIYDQFFEIYNNSSETMYLDGLYLGHLNPLTPTSQAQWPAEDGDNYVYAYSVWKFPGSGNEYPLAPGESCTLTEYALDHSKMNADTPYDWSSADFEFDLGLAGYTGQPAENMVFVFNNGQATTSLKQYNLPNGGCALVLFKVPENDGWDPVNDLTLQAKDLNKPTAKTVYAKIPITYLMDAVEVFPQEDTSNKYYKRIPTTFDAGYTYVTGGAKSGLSVARKLLTDEDGNIVYNEDGSIILQDTNNSSEDFEKDLIPTFHRYGTKMPAWNHTLK